MSIVCVKCGMENADDDVFCGECGTRIDGRRCCPVCQKPIEEGAVFCGECGTRIDGKKLCPCGRLQPNETRFCPACGRAQQAANPSRAQTKKDLNTPCEKNLSGVNKVMAYVATSLSMLALLVFFIAIFTPIFSYNANMTPISFFSSRPMFYEFFYDVFANFSKSNQESNGGYVILGISSLAVLANLVVSTVMFILGLIAGIKSLVKKQPRSIIKYVLVALMVNAAMAAWFSTLSVSVYSSDVGINISYSVGGGSIAAYVFASIAIATCIAQTILQNPKQFSSPKQLASAILAASTILFVAICVGLASSRIIKFGYGISGGIGIAMETVSASGSYAANSKRVANLLLTFGSTIMMVVTVALCLTLLHMLIMRFIDENSRKKSGLALSIPIFVFSILYFILTTIYLELSSTDSYDLSASLATAVSFAFFALGCTIAIKVLNNNKHSASPKETIF